VDQVARDVVAAAPHTTDADLQRWLQRFGDECKALAANGDGTDWHQFKDTLTAWTAEDIPPETVDRFVQYVEAHCSTPMDVLKQIGESGEDLTHVYSESLGWVTTDQQTRLDELWEIRGDWREWLPHELDDRWQGWRTSTPDVLSPWLDEVVASLVLSSGATEEAGSDTPRDESVWAEYMKQWDGDWDGAEDTWDDFAARFVYYAPDGWQSTAQELVDYVGSQPDKAACLTEVYGITVARSDAVDVRGLAWVTPAQAVQLDELWEIRGDWHDWLPAELDNRSPGWTDSSGDELSARLDELIPNLVSGMNTEDAINDAIRESLREALIQVPEAATLSDEELQELLEQALREFTEEANA